MKIRAAMVLMLAGVFLGSGESIAGDACDPWIRAVRESMSLGSNPSWLYQSAQLNDGFAVLVSGNEAYFVRGEEVFAVNGAAKAASPQIPYVDNSAITYEVIAGAIGGGYLIYGKKQGRIVPAICGVLLMVYPYFTDNIWILLLVGAALCVAPYFIRI